jgi:hypothetical protein
MKIKMRSFCEMDAFFAKNDTNFTNFHEGAYN